MSASLWHRVRQRLAVRAAGVGYQIGLIGFVSTRSALRMAPAYIRIHPRYYLRALAIFGMSVASAPLRVWERLRYGRQIAAVRLTSPPIFVIGHWRSGTTHLHNLLTRDPSFGWLSMYQAMAPNCSLVGGRWLKAFFAATVPLKRPMDEMAWPMDAPQEEEIPLAKVTPYSFYMRSLFPLESSDLFRRCVLLQGASPSLAAEIKRHYRHLLQVATLMAGGRRLVLKNPVNTARIKLLLELFPDAKFVHAVRSPYDVFASTSHLHARILPLTTLEIVPEKPSVDAILDIYDAMMRQLVADRTLVPAGNFTEVRFEDLERDPMGELRRVYAELDLPGFADAEPFFRSYVSAQRSYRKNRLTLSPDDRAAVNQRLAFAFDAFGYPMIADSADVAAGAGAH